MTTFKTPDSITVTLDLFNADVRIVASDRVDTIVDVRPRNRSKSADVNAAEETRVDYSEGHLLVKGPAQRRRFGIGGSEAIDVIVHVPSGSSVRGEVVVGELRGQGRLGDCEFKTTVGDITLEQSDALQLETGAGNIVADRVAGPAVATTAVGFVRIRSIDGAATIRNTNGNTDLGTVSGEARLSAANGHITIDRVEGAALAKTAKGNIRINEVVRDSIQLETAHGELEIGIREGTAAWLDVSSLHGSVRNSLKADAGPRESEQTAEIRARTNYGDIVVRRPVP